MRRSGFANGLRRLESRHRAWRYRVRQDPVEIAWLRATLGPGDLAVDVGAYKGGYTYWMRHAVGASGQVLAFEPQPDLADFLRRAVGAFGWTNVDVIAAGLSDTGGERPLHVPGGRPSQRASLPPEGENPGGYPVAIMTLDAHLDGRGRERSVALIKCDVEGHELSVFRGARRTLEMDRPKLLFECEARHDPTRDVSVVFEYLKQLGYQGSFFLDGREVDLIDFDVATHQCPGRRPYINNFVFVPREEG